MRVASDDVLPCSDDGLCKVRSLPDRPQMFDSDKMDKAGRYGEREQTKTVYGSALS
jgi:hypothetical protein